MEFYKSVGLNILEVLEEKKISQTQLASLIGVSKQVMNKIVKGQKAINSFEIKRIADALGVTLERLMFEREAEETEQIRLFMGEVRTTEALKGLEFLEEVISQICLLGEVLEG